MFKETRLTDDAVVEPTGNVSQESNPDFVRPTSGLYLNIVERVRCGLPCNPADCLPLATFDVNTENIANAAVENANVRAGIYQYLVSHRTVSEFYLYRNNRTNYFSVTFVLKLHSPKPTYAVSSSGIRVKIGSLWPSLRDRKSV